MKKATITKLSDSIYFVETDLFMSNLKNWSGKMQLTNDTLSRIQGVLYSYCPRITLKAHAQLLADAKIGDKVTIG
jgi:hypothetical protein